MTHKIGVEGDHSVDLVGEVEEPLGRLAHQPELDWMAFRISARKHAKLPCVFIGEQEERLRHTPYETA